VITRCIAETNTGRQKSRILDLILPHIPMLLWLFVNPMYTQGPQLELSYRTVQPSEMTNWANSIVHNPSRIIVPTSIEELCNTVHESTKVRVIGAGHSWAPLIETTDTLIRTKPN